MTSHIRNHQIRCIYYVTERHDREDDNGVDTVHIRNRQKNVILHEKFDSTKEPRFLYDIALIHLEKDQSLHFNYDLHAVCLGNQTGKLS